MRNRLGWIATFLVGVMTCGGDVVIDPYPSCASSADCGGRICRKDSTCERPSDYGHLCERDVQCKDDGVSCSRPDGWPQSICAVECSAACPQNTACADMLGYCVPKCGSPSDCGAGLNCSQGLCQTLLTETVTQEEVTGVVVVE